MKKTIFFLAFIATMGLLPAQTTQMPQNITLKDLEGNNISSLAIQNGGKPVIILFWTTYCKFDKYEFSAIQKVYDEWQKETGVKLVAVSVDDNRTVSRVKPTVDAYEWPYEFYIDQDHAFFSAMGGKPIVTPYTIIINGSGEVVWSKTGFVEGDEKEIIDKIHNIVK